MNATSYTRPLPSFDRSRRIKTVSDELNAFFDGHKATFTRELRDSFAAYWSAFALQIRTVRNDAGHPMTVDPITPDTLHAALLVFPELARLASNLTAWINNNLK